MIFRELNKLPRQDLVILSEAKDLIMTDSYTMRFFDCRRRMILTDRLLNEISDFLRDHQTRIFRARILVPFAEFFSGRKQRAFS